MEIKSITSNKGNTIHGIYIVKPKVYKDNRGFFYESWNQSSFNDLMGKEIIFSQDNHSSSKCGVIRGLHYQIEPKPQGKLVRCTSGKVFDVAVDIRKSSATFGEWAGIVLNDKNKLMLWIPSGFAHGFLSLEEDSELLYKASGLWSKNHERSIKWNDKSINIKWPLEDINCSFPKISEKDANAKLLEEADIFD